MIKQFHRKIILYSSITKLNEIYSNFQIQEFYGYDYNSNFIFYNHEGNSQ